MPQAALSAVVLIALASINHDRERIKVGAAFELPQNQADALVGCGAARQATDEEVQAFRGGKSGPADQSGGADTAKGASKKK